MHLKIHETAKKVKSKLEFDFMEIAPTTTKLYTHKRISRARIINEEALDELCEQTKKLVIARNHDLSTKLKPLLDAVAHYKDEASRKAAAETAAKAEAMWERDLYNRCYRVSQKKLPD